MTSAQMIAARAPLSDTEFVRLCGLGDDPLSSKMAVRVRRAIARLGSVPADRIYASDSFRKDLISLPFWDSLDAVQFRCVLEDELGVALSTEEATAVPDPDWQAAGFTVADMARCVARIPTLRERLVVP